VKEEGRSLVPGEANFPFSIVSCAFAGCAIGRSIEQLRAKPGPNQHP
jgi:hypothetical protein